MGGAAISSQESGVSSFNPTTLKEYINGLTCAIKSEEVVYSDAAENIWCDTRMTSCKPVSVFLDDAAIISHESSTTTSGGEGDVANEASQMIFGWVSVVSPLLLAFLS